MYQGFWGILLMLIYDVWFLKSKILFLVYDLKNYTDDKSCYTKACEHNQWGCIVKLCSISNSLVGGCENLANEQWEQLETDVLYPED